MSPQPPLQSIRQSIQLTADGMPVDPGRTPRQVRAAVGLLVMVAFLGVVTVVLDGRAGWELISDRVGHDFGARVAQEMWVDFLVHSVGIDLPVFLAFLVFLGKTWQGRNWARITSTVFAALALLQLGNVPGGLVESSVLVPWIAVGVLTAAGAAFGLVLLWREPTRTWFAAMRAYRAAWGFWPKR